MTVYVYKLPGQWQTPFGARGAPLPWYGLTGDTEEELHALAESIGLYRHFYHPSTVTGRQQSFIVGHYDIDQGERDMALAAGAQPVTWRKWARIMGLNRRE